MATISYWLAEPHDPLPAVRLGGAPDVAVVGGGITGCSCALALAEAGLRVRLYEAREVAGGASGRNGGFALRGGSAPYPVLAESIGSEQTAPLGRWWGGFARGWRDELPPPLDGRYPGAIFHPPDGVLQPARLVRRLATRAAEAGVEIREHTRGGAVGGAGG